MLRTQRYAGRISSGCCLHPARSSPFQTNRQTSSPWLRHSPSFETFPERRLLNSGLTFHTPFHKGHYIVVTFHFMMHSVLSITHYWPHSKLDLWEGRFSLPLPLWAPFSLAYLAIKQLCFPPLIIYLHFFSLFSSSSHFNIWLSPALRFNFCKMGLSLRLVDALFTF